jgi:mono/diheme cytochrome c family protein
MKSPILGCLLAVTVSACVTTYDPLEDYEEMRPPKIMEAPTLQPDQIATQNPEQVTHGRYLVELIGCATCHTDGALIGEPRLERWLAGSRVGIAYSNPLKYRNPGVVYAPNLTPDQQTGIGSWTEQQLAAAIRGDEGLHGRRQLPVMPRASYANLTESDLAAIVAYLRSLPPVHHEVPEHVAPGEKATELFVHFGVYRSRT